MSEYVIMHQNTDSEIKNKDVQDMIDEMYKVKYEIFSIERVLDRCKIPPSDDREEDDTRLREFLNLSVYCEIKLKSLNREYQKLMRFVLFSIENHKLESKPMR